MNRYLYFKNKTQYRINEDIRGIKEVRLVGHNIYKNDVITLEKAQSIAVSDELDLVEINPDANPSVCKIMDYTKFIFKQKQKKRNNKSIPMKEVKLSTHIGDNDLKHKTRQIKNFLIKGHVVKLFLMFKGREITHKNIGKAVFLKILENITDVGIFDLKFELRGKKMTHLIKPKKL